MWPELGSPHRHSGCARSLCRHLGGQSPGCSRAIMSKSPRLGPTATQKPVDGGNSSLALWEIHGTRATYTLQVNLLMAPLDCRWQDGREPRQNVHWMQLEFKTRKPVAAESRGSPVCAEPSRSPSTQFRVCPLFPSYCCTRPASHRQPPSPSIPQSCRWLRPWTLLPSPAAARSLVGPHPPPLFPWSMRL